MVVVPAQHTSAVPARPSALDAAALTAVQTPTSLVLGPEVAGYRSVVTKNPVSPSGYALGAPAAAAAAAGTTTAYRSSGVPAAATTVVVPPQLGSVKATAPGSSSAVTAAAAAAALAALGSRSKLNLLDTVAEHDVARATSGVHTDGSYSTCRMPEFSVAEVAAAAGLQDSCWSPTAAAAAAAAAAAEGHAGPATLRWNVQEWPPVQQQQQLQQQPIAGRRAEGRSASQPRGGSGFVEASGLEACFEDNKEPNCQLTVSSSSSRRNAAAQQLTGYCPSSLSHKCRSDGSGSSSSDGAADCAAAAAAAAVAAGSMRPPSQQLSEGLSKLKQLSTARLATRLTTPPSSSNSSSVAGTATDSNLKSQDGSSRRSGRRGNPVSAVLPDSEGHSSSCTFGRTDSGRAQNWVGKQQQQQTLAPGSSSHSSSTHTPGNYASNNSSSSIQRTASRGRMPVGAAGSATVAGGGIQRTVSRGRTGRGLSAAVSPMFESHGGKNLNPDEEEEYLGQQGVLQQCPTCGRSFIPSAFERHAKVCARVFCKKRQVRRVLPVPSMACVLRGGGTLWFMLHGASCINKWVCTCQLGPSLGCKPGVQHVDLF